MRRTKRTGLKPATWTGTRRYRRKNTQCQIVLRGMLNSAAVADSERTLLKSKKIKNQKQYQTSHAWWTNKIRNDNLVSHLTKDAKCHQPRATRLIYSIETLKLIDLLKTWPRLKSKRWKRHSLKRLRKPKMRQWLNAAESSAIRKPRLLWHKSKKCTLSNSSNNSKEPCLEKKSSKLHSTLKIGTGFRDGWRKVQSTLGLKIRDRGQRQLRTSLPWSSHRLIINMVINANHSSKWCRLRSELNQPSITTILWTYKRMPTQTCVTHLKVDWMWTTTKAALLMHWQRLSIWIRTTPVSVLDKEGNWIQVNKADLAFWDNRDTRSAVTRMAHNNQIISVLMWAKPDSTRLKSIHQSSATAKVINSNLKSTGINLRCRNLRSQSIVSSGSSLTRSWTNNWCNRDLKAHTISSQVQPTSTQRLGKLIRWRRWNLPTPPWNHPLHCLSNLSQSMRDPRPPK